ncbi:MAG: 30S ribosomal protein S14 [Chlamydiia bacterium]|nr:30S ribosomal protein S14 [Chlamydiia bacterium]
MAKKSMVARDKKREALVKRMWDKRQVLKKAVINPELSEEERETARIALNKMPRDSCPVRIRRRCKLTGRPRGNYRKFGISRLCFREMASTGMIPGVTKSSW